MSVAEIIKFPMGTLAVMTTLVQVGEAKHNLSTLNVANAERIVSGTDTRTNVLEENIMVFGINHSALCNLNYFRGKFLKASVE